MSAPMFEDHTFTRTKLPTTVDQLPFPAHFPERLAFSKRVDNGIGFTSRQDAGERALRDAHSGSRRSDTASKGLEPFYSLGR